MVPGSSLASLAKIESENRELKGLQLQNSLLLDVLWFVAFGRVNKVMYTTQNSGY